MIKSRPSSEFDNAPMTTNQSSLDLRETIRKQRKKRERNALVLKIIAFILVFCIGFCSGMIYTIKSDIKTKITSGQNTDTKKDMAQPGEARDDADADHKVEDENAVYPAVPVDEDNTNDKEMAELEKLKQEFITYVKSKYPSVDLSFAIKNLDTGAFISYDNKKMNSASIIKLFILETVYDEIANGTYTLTQQKENELAKMITESNNNAANGFIDDFGGVDNTRKIPETNLINQNIKNHGYKYTEANRKMHDTTPPEGPSGYQNYSSVEDVCVFLEGVYRKTLFNEPFNTSTLNLLKNQKRRTKIPAKIVEKYPDIVVANKTGELSAVENDAALIMCDDFNLVFVVFIDNIPPKENGSTDYKLKENIQVTISELGLKLVEFYKANDF